MILRQLLDDNNTIIKNTYIKKRVYLIVIMNITKIGTLLENQ